MRLPRLVPLVGAAVAAPAVLLLGVMGGTGPLPVLALLAVAGGRVVLWRRSPAALVDVGGGREPAPAPARVGDPAGAPAPAPAAAPAGRGRGSVVRSLARVEARDLAANGWMAGAVGFCLLFLVLAGGILAEDFERSWWGYTAVLLLFAHPACGFSLVAVHRAVTRGARDGVEELYRACPVDPATRARGHLLSGLAVAAGMALFAAVMTVAVAVRSTAMYGPFDARVAADLVLVPVLALGAVATGVALGRWRRARWTLAPVLAVIAIAVIEQALVEAGDVGGKGGRLSAFGIWPEGDPIFVEPR
ncbi:MAG TPA: hypothetical protein VFO65_03315, partial [Acidimicrobiales bacterium]|nr:hypothetical protein [Acidimicrobiales bacterium]